MVTCASRTLSAAKQRFSQIEKRTACHRLLVPVLQVVRRGPVDLAIDGSQFAHVYVSA